MEGSSMMIDPDKTLAQLSTILTSLSSLTALGVPGYILMAAFVVAAAAFYWWVRSRADQLAKQASEEKTNQDQQSGKQDNQNVSDQWNQAHGKIEDIRKDNPDVGKKPR
jgi:Flp pilus assembly protein TadB